MRPGQAFALIANGQRVMVTCPANARPGQKIRFQLPIKLSSDEIQSIKLNYQKDGWIRCLSTDLTFHWVRSEAEADSDHESKKKLEWAFERTAFVRELRTLTVGTSTSKATHSLQLVPAKDAALSTVVPAINNGTSLAQELSRYAAMPFQHKEAWFRQQIAKLQVPWEDGHIPDEALGVLAAASLAGVLAHALARRARRRPVARVAPAGGIVLRLVVARRHARGRARYQRGGGDDDEAHRGRGGRTKIQLAMLP